jgi:DNA adenine methylase
MGKGETLRLGFGGNKPDISVAIEQIIERFGNTKFTNFDFRDILKKIALRGERDKQRAFIYCDPPYLGTGNNYSDGFTQKDSADLFAMLQDSGIKWAMSEFDHPFIMETADKLKLNIIEIGERKNLGNRRTEFLITNYQKAA